MNGQVKVELHDIGHKIIGVPTPHFSPKMTQNGLKWILNISLKNVTIWEWKFTGDKQNTEISH